MTPVWKAYYFNINAKAIRTCNVFEHAGFYKDCVSAYKKCKTFAEFAEEVRKDLMYRFWSKAEWEVLICPWIGGSVVDDSLKVDVYRQVMENWEPFIQYTWEFFRANGADDK